MTARSLAILLAATVIGCGGDDAADAENAIVVTEVADVGFQTPESVIHDAAADAYLVSNINGTPTDEDDNGFISRVTPDGMVEDIAWITGESDDVTLNAPKGMAIRGDTLYVADITCVRMFARPTGEPAGEVCIDGATFLNDVTVAGDGTLYVTDSGFNADFTASGTDAVWRFTPGGQTNSFTSGPQLGNPNGIAFTGDTAYVVTFGSGEVYSLAPEGTRRVLVAPDIPDRQLDGIAFVNEGGYVFSSWGDGAVHRVNVAGAVSTVLDSLDAPADIGYDAQRNRVLVPLFNQDMVIWAEVPPAPAPAAF